MTNIKVDKVARLILNADGTYTTVTEEVFNGKTYNVYLPTVPTSTSHERWHQVWLEHLKRSEGIYPYGVTIDDVRYGILRRFNDIMAALANIYNLLHIPKAYVNIYRTHLCKQWEPLSDGHSKHIIDLERRHDF